MDRFEKIRPPVCLSHREVVAHLIKSEVKVIGQGQGHFKNCRTYLPYKIFILEKFEKFSHHCVRLIEKYVVAHSQNFKVKVKGQGHHLTLTKVNGRPFRNQRAKGNLHADFERNHYSNLNPNCLF